MHSELRTVSEEKSTQRGISMEEQLSELYPKLQRYCRFLSQNSNDSEDLAQETLMKAWQRYRHQPVLTAALLNKIAHNTWIDIVRKRSKESFEEMPDGAIERVAKDTDQDFFMSAEEAKEYGIIDEVIN